MLKKQRSRNQKPMWLKDLSQVLFPTKLQKVPAPVGSGDLLEVFQYDAECKDIHTFLLCFLEKALVLSKSAFC